MAIDESSLQKKHNLVKLTVHSSTQISSRTSTIITRLREQVPPPPEDHDTSQETPVPALPTIVILTAQAKVANKLISIVEIAKRELGGKVFQYNALSSQIHEIEREKPSKKGARGGAQEEGENDSDDAFETMGELALSATKKRSVPSLTIYLSTSSVRELKNAYGEQT